MPRPAKLTLAILLLTTILLELVLQVWALGYWLFPDHDLTVTEGQPVVMCVGDSYTYGMGASSPAGAYPAQLQHLLRERTGLDWRVINKGWPGRNSRRVLEDHIGKCTEAFGRRPTFVSVDFYDIGDVIEVVADMNGLRN